MYQAFQACQPTTAKDKRRERGNHLGIVGRSLAIRFATVARIPLVIGVPNRERGFNGGLKMILDIKVKFNKDQFRLLDKLSGEPICCATCKHFSSPDKT